MTRESRPEDYKYIDTAELRQLCAFKDNTIAILQNALNNVKEESPKDTVTRLCDVMFHKTGTTYTYRTGTVFPKVGDTVYVPASFTSGHTIEDQHATVVAVYNRTDVPEGAYKTIHNISAARSN